MYLLVLPSLSTGESQWAPYVRILGDDHGCAESMLNMDEKKNHSTHGLMKLRLMKIFL